VDSSLLIRGFRSGVQTSWLLIKVMVPVYICVRLLQATPVLPTIAHWLEPVMGLLGLPGAAATPLVLGMLINHYAAVGAAATLHMTPWQLTVLAIILGISHNNFVEGAVIRNVTQHAFFVNLLRVVMAFLVGLLLNLPTLIG